MLQFKSYVVTLTYDVYFVLSSALGSWHVDRLWLIELENFYRTISSSEELSMEPHSNNQTTLYITENPIYLQ